MLQVSVMMALGVFRFGLAGESYQEFSREAAYRWEAVPRHGRAPALQYAGPGEESVRLRGIIYPHFRGGLRQVELMRLQAGLGRPLMMVDGLGWVWKRWVITAVSEEKRLFLADGAPRRIDFTLSLAAYGGDGNRFVGGLL